jgi:hypothetical protein
MLQHEQLLLGTDGKWATRASRIFQSQLSLKNFFNRRDARQEVLRKYSGTGKRILLKKRRKLRPKRQGRPPGAESVLAG